MSERGPVGGAGELTVRAALELMVSELKWYASKHGLGPARLQYALAQGEAALAAKAPQGVLGQREVDDLKALAEHITHLIQSLLTLKYENSFKVAHGIIERELLRFNAALAAPPALPVPGPVSDTTIHHGMFPPTAPSPRAYYHKAIDRVLEMRKLDLERAHDPALAKEQEYYLGRAHRCDDILFWLGHIESNLPAGEAAAPKPAPAEGIQHPGWGYDPDGNWVRQQPTPAPGAERLRETLTQIAHIAGAPEGALPSLWADTRRQPRHPSDPPLRKTPK